MAARRISAILAVALLGAALPARLSAKTSTVESFFDGNEPMTRQRLFRDGDASTCESAQFPGEILGQSFWRSFRFCPSEEQTCYTATFDEGTCGDDVHLSAYRSAFDPDDLMTNYIGDVGSSDTLPFSFVVPPGDALYIVAQTNFGMAHCRFGFTVDAGPCTAGAPLLSGVGAVLAGAALLLTGVVALRRPRQALAAAALLVGLALPAGLAVAPLAAGVPPVVGRDCQLACSATYRACATELCNSGPFDRDRDCLEGCRDEHALCVEACS